MHASDASCALSPSVGRRTRLARTPHERASPGRHHLGAGGARLDGARAGELLGAAERLGHADASNAVRERHRRLRAARKAAAAFLVAESLGSLATGGDGGGGGRLRPRRRVGAAGGRPVPPAATAATVAALTLRAAAAAAAGCSDRGTRSHPSPPPQRGRTPREATKTVSACTTAENNAAS